MSTDWVSDFDRHEIDLGSFRTGPYGKAVAKGRCIECWGRLVGRKREGEDGWSQVKCRICDVVLDGADADLEVESMEQESWSNLMNMRWGHVPKYREDAVFVRKLFPRMSRQDGAEIKARVGTKTAEGRKKGFLTRSGFPTGAPGYLFMQACILMAGLERMPFEMSVSALDGIDLKDDGTAVVPVPVEEFRDDPQFLEYALRQRMGSTMTMTAAMMGAFACELTMKAISLTMAYEAPMGHDLLLLFDGLPDASRKRVEADFGDIRRVMEECRYLFDKWRYFDSNVGGNATHAMIDKKRGFELGKAARILLDEAETAGLTYTVTLNTKARVRRRGQRKDYRFLEDLQVRVGESPPKSKPS